MIERGRVIRMGFNASTARQVLVDLKTAQRGKWLAEATEFRLWAELADQYRHLPQGDDATGPVLPGAEKLVRLGDDGTPLVAEFCTLEASAVMGCPELHAIVDIGSALNVRHRTPKIWARVMQARFRVWKARRLADLMHRLNHTQAMLLDQEVVGFTESMSFTRLEELVKARVIELLPEEAEAAHRDALQERHVTFQDRGTPTNLGTTHMEAGLDTADARFLNAQLDQIARILHQAGSSDTLNVRRSLALGVLASPARALQLLQVSLLDELPDMTAVDELDVACPARGQRGHTCGTITTDPAKLLPRAELVVHISADSPAFGQGLARVEQVGPMVAGWLKDLLSHTHVTVRPVLNPNNLVPTDAYECPAAMREWVQLRNPYEAFPYSQRRSGKRGMDLDHTEPFQWDQPPTWQGTRKAWLDPTIGETTMTTSPPRGQTHPGNLGFLSRKVHRMKTHSGAQLTQSSPGTFLWRSPLGFGYLVTPSHTWMIEDPTGQILPKQDRDPDREHASA